MSIFSGLNSFFRSIFSADRGRMVTPNENIDYNKRTIYLSSSQPHKFLSNKISTAKYSPLLFIPKFLFEQFRRYANLFFLFIALLQQIPGVSPTGQFTTAIPLLMILTVSAVKEIFEDIKRRKADDEINRRKILTLRNHRFEHVEWRHVVVGDYVKVEDNDFFPADLVLLSSSEPQGMCYIETSNLDGETNLKIRQGIHETSSMVDHEALERMDGCLETEPPNAHLYEFVATLRPYSNQTHKIYPIGPDQMLLRGSMLKNTKWIFGIVVYTGHETKYMLNSTVVPLKRSTVERVVNRQILMLFVILIILAFVSSVASQIWLNNNKNTHWYLAISELKSSNFLLNFLTFVILYNNLIPISLQVTLEIVRFIQAIFIQMDIEMYDEVHDTPTVAKTSNLNEELGQVSFVFSDKTGTLTCNEMNFIKCTISGIKYGDNEDGHKFNDPNLLKNYKEHKTSGKIKEFFSLLAVCHTVVPDREDVERVGGVMGEDVERVGGVMGEEVEKDGGIMGEEEVWDPPPHYMASSPDELALVLGAKSQGFYFFSRSHDSVSIKIHGKVEKYKILNILAFTSDRKRMSVVVRDPSGKIKIFCKGADTVIFPRLSKNQEILSTTISHLEEFASQGLRTLCIATGDIKEEDYRDWLKIYEEASTSLQGRIHKLAEAAELIEQNMTLLGATAIEDKLQEGVPDTISSLLKANIKVWVLTGDKQETAVNIGYASKLFSHGMRIIFLNETSLDDTANTLRSMAEEFVSKVTYQTSNIGLIADGETLKHAMSYRCQNDFLNLLLICKSVICCRMSPLQKSDLVNLIKVRVKVITLAIGDGANDVGMIQAAHVGVGISGKEGLQASCASDYSIGQFRFLKRLLLVHGSWSYNRLTTLILYSFYKNICLYLIEFWFAVMSAFSGQIFFERWCIGLYNVIFTAATPMAIGLFDKHCSGENLLKHPPLYSFTQKSQTFNVKVFWLWCGNSIFHSIIFFWVSVQMLKHEIAFSDGKVGDYLFLGNMVYTYVVVAVCIKGGIESNSWNWLTHLSIWGSILSWFIFLAIYPHVWPTLNLAPEMVGMSKYVYTCPFFWLGLLLVPTIVLFSDIITKAIQRTFWKSYPQQIQELEGSDQSPSSISFRNSFQQSRSYTADDPNKIEESSINAEQRGFAFSQEENGAVEQEELVKAYEGGGVKPKGW